MDDVHHRISSVETTVNEIMSSQSELVKSHGRFERALEKAEGERLVMSRDVTLIKRIVTGDDEMDGGLRADVKDIGEQLRLQLAALNARHARKGRIIKWGLVLVTGPLALSLINHISQVLHLIGKLLL